jgi:hypothetical protein
MAEKAEELYENLLGYVETIMKDSDVTTGSQLLKYGRLFFGRKFTGVFARDQMPVNFQYMIVNLDNSDEPGSHWMACVRDTNGVLVYDSFGRNIPLFVNQINTESDQEQHIQEENCGQRCLAFLLVYDYYGFNIAKKI